MRFPHHRTTRLLAMLVTIAAAITLGARATADQNMAASRKANLVPGKQLQVPDQGDDLVFCEVALINGTSQANAICCRRPGSRITPAFAPTSDHELSIVAI